MSVTGQYMEVSGLVEQRKALESLLMSGPAMEKKVQQLVRQVLSEVRTEMTHVAMGAMRSDPRQAHRAVKMAIYKRILGGSVSILDRRSAGSAGNYEPVRKLRDGQRGGNRVPRSSRTQQVMDYVGMDRAFILRFLNSGTSQRTAGSRSGRLSGNRGSIAPRNFWSGSSRQAMEKGAEKLARLIDEMITKESQ